LLKRAWNIFWEKIDWLLLLPCVGLSVLGVVLMIALYQSVWLSTLRLTENNIVMQGVAIALGIAAALIIANIDYRALVDRWLFTVPFFFILFLSTFVFGEGTQLRPDDKRWLILPGLGSVQPSEFLKVAFIISFAYHIYKTQDRFNHPLNILFLLIHALVPVGLVQLQGDSGTALMFVFIFLAMMFVAGIKWYYITAAAVGVPAMVPLAWMFLLKNWQKERILVALGQAPAVEGGRDPTFQPRYAAQAIADGGLLGNGIFNPRPAYVPEMHNDFIFAFIANSTGFLGCAAVILTIAFIGGKMLYNCGIANDKQGQVICAGVFAMIFGQSALNICMTLSILPVIGNSLPFVSSGGSFLLATFMAVGLVMSVSKHTRRRVSADSFLP
jgi:rod shape determining protein RodA